MYAIGKDRLHAHTGLDDLLSRAKKYNNNSNKIVYASEEYES